MAQFINKAAAENCCLFALGGDGSMGKKVAVIYGREALHQIERDGNGFR